MRVVSRPGFASCLRSMTGRPEYGSTAIRVTSPSDKSKDGIKLPSKSSCGHRPSSPRSGETGLAAKAAAAVAARNARRSSQMSSPCLTPVTPPVPANRSRSSDVLKKMRADSSSCSTPAPPQKSVSPSAAPHYQRMSSSALEDMASPRNAPKLLGKAVAVPRLELEQAAAATRHFRVDADATSPGIRHACILQRVGEHMQASGARLPSDAAASPCHPQYQRQRPSGLMSTPRSDFHTDVSSSCETPNALTDAALRRSEKLLADLAALGFAEARNDCVEETYSCPSSSTTPSPMSSRPNTPREDRQDGVLNEERQEDMVEVPAALLELWMETWSKKYQSLTPPNCMEVAQASAHRTTEVTDGTWSPRLFVDSLASTMASIDLSSPHDSAGTPTFADKVNRGLLSPKSIESMTKGSVCSTDVPAEFLSTFSSTYSSGSDSSIAIARKPCQFAHQAVDLNPCQVIRRTSLPGPAPAQRIVVPAPVLSLAASHGGLAKQPMTCTVEQTITFKTTYLIH